MDLDFSAEDEGFRQDVRRYFASVYPQDILAKLRNGQQLKKADIVGSEQALSRQGWLAPNWPKAFGGPGWSVTQRLIFDDELERAGAPNVTPMGLLYVAPIIFTFGTDAQKDRWLPGILSATDFWAQGYSEPEAGSDLASLTTTAERRGDDYVVNGTKIWTSQAHYANWVFCLVRTARGERKQEGISFLCIEMDSPGVEVHPIIGIDSSHHLNRVSFTDVVVPAANRIGDEGRGWYYARELLNYERTSYAHVAGKRRMIAEIREAAKVWPSPEVTAPGGALSLRLAETEIALTALEYTLLRVVAPLQAGEPPGEESSILKVLATENAQAITERGLELVGPYAAPAVANRYADDWRKGLEDVPAYAVPATASYFFERSQTIYGGATEVQKNIIFKLIAGKA